MRIEIAHITPRRQRLKSAAARALLEEYVQRAGRYAAVSAQAYDSEQAIFAALDRAGGRTPVTLVLLDSRGQSMTSEEIADRVGKLRDGGAQLLVFAVGPADGWSRAAWTRADVRLSFGAITLPHELALAVLAEQIYRALTILAGHPYHSGHGAA